MKRRRRIITAVLVALLLTLTLMFCRYYWLDRMVASRLDRLYQKTGVRVTYDTIDVSFTNALFHHVLFFFEEESVPFAKTDVVTVDWLKQTVSVDEARIRRHGVIGAGRGQFHLFNNAMDVEVSMPPVLCANFLGSFPAKFREKIGGVKVEGKVALDIHFRLDSEDPKRDRLDGELDNGCRIASYGTLPPPDMFRKPFRHRVYDQYKKPFDITTGVGSANWVDYEDISRYAIEAVLEAEDPLFYKHDGIMLSRIKTAARVNLKRRMLRYGASTITMQTAKNLFLTREKTASRKLQEIFFVWYLESNFTKDDILTLYLNLAELGPSLYGIKAAADHYFGRSPKALDLRQSAFLAKLLPRPIERHDAKVKGKVPEDLARRIRALLYDMLKSGRISEEAYDEALSEKITFDRRDAHSIAEPPLPKADVSPLHVTRISSPRTKTLLPPLTKIISDRKRSGSDLSP